MRRADRLFQLVQLLRGRRRSTAAFLAQRMDVSLRTIYRDVADLQLQGVPVEGEAGVGYRLGTGFDLPPMMFSKDEARSLVASVRLAQAWLDPGLARYAQDALGKILSVLPADARAAAEQLQGRLGDEVSGIRADLLENVAHIEAWIDFPEEGIDPATGALLVGKISAGILRIENLLSTAENGRVLREGVRVAIVGRPNVGKSSLLNRLLGMERAIVSPIPGTTRDTIEESACLQGILFRLTDTAGLRETGDPVEREGVDRALRTLDQADLVLHILDASAEFNEPELREREILVANKIDLIPHGAPLPAPAVGVSSKTGEGFSELVEAMLRETCGRHLSSGHSLAAVNARHKVLLAEATTSLHAAKELIQAGEPPELTAIELRAALGRIGQIIGAADSEEILGEIFGRFCIGK